MLNINVEKKLSEMQLAVKLQIPTQGVTGIFGLSGSGKSSFINLISGLLTPDRGTIQLNDKILVDTQKNICLPPHQRHIGYVFQDARLFPHYRVKGNLCYGMKGMKGMNGIKEMKEKPSKSAVNFEQVLSLLGIEHLLKRFPITLSGGEKQRVAIGRALLSNPDILLMDEPLSALDLPRKQELLRYLEKLASEIQIPILYVTHSLDELNALAERVILMDNGKVMAYDEVGKVVESAVFNQWK